MAFVVATEGGGRAQPTLEGPGTRERLVAAAAEVFAERGYEGSRVAEIARRAGLTTGAIYANFRGKADLLLEAIGTAPFDLLFSDRRAGISATAALERAGQRLVAGGGGIRRALLFEALVAARRDAEVAALLRERMLERAGLLAGLIAEGQRDGELDADVDTEAVARLCHAIALGFLLTDALALPRPDKDAWADVVHRVVTAFSSSKETTNGDH